MILDEKLCSRNARDLVFDCPWKTEIGLKLPQNVFQELLCCICNNLFFRIMYFIVVYSCIQTKDMIF